MKELLNTVKANRALRQLLSLFGALALMVMILSFMQALMAYQNLRTLERQDRFNQSQVQFDQTVTKKLEAKK